jgi:glycosyltransferase involved in cell wall biosynthesis
MADTRAPRTVIHLITRLDWGGSAQNTLLTAIGHDRARFLPIVVAGAIGRWDDQGGREAGEAQRAVLQRAGVRWQVLPSVTRELHPIKDLVALRQLIRLFRRERPVIVHTHTSKAGALGRLAAWIARVPVLVHTPHGHVYYGHFGPFRSWLFLRIERVLARVTTVMIALTEAEREEHLSRGVGRRETFAVAASGIDVERFRRVNVGAGAKPAGATYPAGAYVIGSVGWLTPVKGHAVLIEALARMKPKYPQVHLLLIGSGGLRDDLQRLAARLGVEASVDFLGMRRDVAECLAALDCFVLPSLNEGMGRALVEAMAAARPVVASRVGGIPTIVEDRRTGLLVPPGDPDALAAAIAELIARPDWARTLALAGRERIDAGFSVPGMVRAIEAVYDDAMKRVGTA